LAGPSLFRPRKPRVQNSTTTNGPVSWRFDASSLPVAPAGVPERITGESAEALLHRSRL
jgi:hypothetical protein